MLKKFPVLNSPDDPLPRTYIRGHYVTSLFLVSGKLTWHHHLIRMYLGSEPILILSYRRQPYAPSGLILSSCPIKILYARHTIHAVWHLLSSSLNRSFWWRLVKGTNYKAPHFEILSSRCYVFCLKSQYFGQYHDFTSVCKSYEQHCRGLQVQFPTLVLHRTYLWILTPALGTRAFYPQSIFMGFGWFSL